MKKELHIHEKPPFTKCSHVTGNMTQQVRSCVPIRTTLRFLSVTLGTVAILSIGAPAYAQTLDAAINNQLVVDCAVLGMGQPRLLDGFGDPELGFAGLGPNLNAICVRGTGGAAGMAGVPSGGGAGSSPQALAVSVENRRKEVFEEERKEAESLGQGWSLFVTGNIEALNRDKTTFADGYDSDIGGVTVGADKLFTKQLLAGLAFTYTNTNADFDGGGGFHTNSYGGTLYGSFLPAPGFFVDLAAGFARKDYNVSRSTSYTEITQTQGNRLFSGTVNSDTDGNEISARALLGYDHSIKNMTIGPRFGLNWTNTHIDDYSEQDGGAASPGGGGAGGLALQYDDQWVNSLQSVVGLQGSVTISTGLGVFVPQFNADYIHEFANSQRFVTVQFVEDLRQNPSRFRFQTEKPVRNFFNLGTGVVAILPHGIQPFVNFRVMVGNQQFNNYAGSFGVRIEM